MLNKINIMNEVNDFLKEDITIRELSKRYNRSKSAIHKDLTINLQKINKEKYEEVKKKLEKHKKTKHIKGGEATKRKYQKLNEGYK